MCAEPLRRRPFLNINDDGLCRDAAGRLTFLLERGFAPILLDPETMLPVVSGPRLGSPSTASEAIALAKRHPDAAIGLLTGEGICAVACEGPDAREAFVMGCAEMGIDAEATARVMAFGATHFLFCSPHGAPFVKDFFGIEGATLKGRGGFIPICAPDGSGRRSLDLLDSGLLGLPEALLEKTGAAAASSEGAPPADSLEPVDVPLEAGAIQAPAASEPPSASARPACRSFGRLVPPDEVAEWDPSPEEIAAHHPKLKKALELAAKGIPVAWCDPATKKPHFSEASCGDKQGATTDPEKIICRYEYCLRMRLPAIPLIRTGLESGLLVLDLDKKDGRDGVKAFDRLCHEHGCDPGSFRTIRTPTGGLHVHFKASPEAPVGCIVDWMKETIGRGFDMRGEGGLAVPPGVGIDGKGDYTLLNDVPPTDIPPFLLKMLKDWLKAKAAKKTAKPRDISASQPGIGAFYLDRCCRKVAGTPEGSRNDTLRDQAGILGRLAGLGEVDRELAEARLLAAALESGLAPAESAATIRSGLDYGEANSDSFIDVYGYSAAAQERQPPAPSGEPDADFIKRAILDDASFRPGALTDHVCKNGVPDFDEIMKFVLPEAWLRAVRLGLDHLGQGKDAGVLVTASGVSAALGASRAVRWGELPGQACCANLFLLIAGDTGCGKTDLVKFFYDPIDRAQHRAFVKFAADMERYREELAEWERSRGKSDRQEKPKQPVLRIYALQDTTQEAMWTRLSENQGGFVIKIDEGKSMFKSLTRYNAKGDDDFKNKLTSCWKGEPLHVSRQNMNGEPRSQYIAPACLSIVANIQTGLLKSFFTADDAEQGFLCRWIFLFLPARPGGELPDLASGRDPELKKALDFMDAVIMLLTELDLIRDEKEGMRPLELWLSDEALAFYNSWLKDVSRDLNWGNLRRFMPRMIEMLPRFALILHYLWWACEAVESGVENAPNPDTRIELIDFQRAAEVAKIYFLHLDRALWRLNRQEAKKLCFLDSVREGFVRFVLQEREFFNRPRAIKELAAKGYGPAKEVHKFKHWLKQEGFESEHERIPGRVQKYFFLNFPAAWLESPTLQRLVFTESGFAPYASAVREHWSEIESAGFRLPARTFASWFGWEEADLESDDTFKQMVGCRALPMEVHQESVIFRPETLAACDKLLAESSIVRPAR